MTHFIFCLNLIIFSDLHNIVLWVSMHMHRKAYVSLQNSGSMVLSVHKQDWFRPSVICLTKCTFLGQAHQVNLCTYYMCNVFKYCFYPKLYYPSNLPQRWLSHPPPYFEIPSVPSVPETSTNSIGCNTLPLYQNTRSLECPRNTYKHYWLLHPPSIPKYSEFWVSSKYPQTLLAVTSLHLMTLIGKQFINFLYGPLPGYSYRVCEGLFFNKLRKCDPTLLFTSCYPSTHIDILKAFF